MAGHSKWANIQHRKGGKMLLALNFFQNYQKRLQLLLKWVILTQKKPRLRLAVKEAKQNSVPKDVIEGLLKNQLLETVTITRK